MEVQVNHSDSKGYGDLESFVPWDNPDNVITFETFTTVDDIINCYINPFIFFIGVPTNVLSCVVFFRQGSFFFLFCYHHIHLLPHRHLRFLILFRIHFIGREGGGELDLTVVPFENCRRSLTSIETILLFSCAKCSSFTLLYCPEYIFNCKLGQQWLADVSGPIVQRLESSFAYIFRSTSHTSESEVTRLWTFQGVQATGER